MENGSKIDFEELYYRLRDPDQDIFEDNMELMDMLWHSYHDKKMKSIKWLGKCIHVYLLRLQTQYLAIYAITIGQFTDFETVAASHVDPDGFTHLATISNGRYDNYQHGIYFNKK